MSTRTPDVVDVNLACALRPHDVMLDYKLDPWATVIGVMQAPSEMPGVVAIYVLLHVNREVLVLPRLATDPVDIQPKPDSSGGLPGPMDVVSQRKRFGDLLVGDLLQRPAGYPRFYVLDATSYGSGLASVTIYNFGTGERYSYHGHVDDEVLVVAR